MNDVKIILKKSSCSNKEGYLDINKVAGFGLNFSIDDVKKIDSKNTSYSKTIILSNSKNNNIELGNFYDINSTFTFFNPNYKVDAFILMNETVVMDGYFQLKNIRKINNSDMGGNEIQYEILFYDETLNMFDRIGNRNLSELDLTSFNHPWNFQSITHTWGVRDIQRVSPGLPDQNFGTGSQATYWGQQTYVDANTWEDCYVYPQMFNGDLTDGNLINDGSNEYTTEDFYPAIFSKFYLWKMLNDIGIEVGGDFFENDERFDKEIIPYDGGVPLYDEAVQNSTWGFQVGRDSDYVSMTREIVPGTIQVGGIPTTPFVGVLPFTQHSDYVFSSLDLNIDNHTPSSPIYPSLYDNASLLSFDGNWHINAPGPISTGSYFTPLQTGDFDIFIDMFIKLEYYVESLVGDVLLKKYIPTEPFVIEVGGAAIDNASGYLSVISTPISESVEITDTMASGSTFSQTVRVTGKIISDVHLTPFDKLFPTIVLKGTDPYMVGDTSVNGVETTQSTTTITVLEDGSDLGSYYGNFKSRMWNVLKSGQLNGGVLSSINEGNMLKLSAFIPRDLTQMSFINDLIMRYNLYTTNDITNPNKILFYSRDKYYKQGSDNKTLDWTDKIYNNQEQKIQLLSELSKKRIIFSYKQGEDDYSKAYKSSTDEIYGTKKIEFDNSFLKGDEKIESIFTSTPSVRASTDDIRFNIVPSIQTITPKSKPRVLLFNRIIDIIDNTAIEDTHIYMKYSFNDHRDNEPGQLYIYSTPYAGMWDHPYKPTFDLCWNKVPYIFYTSGPFHYNPITTTDNNLYNAYWRNYINQISTGKLLTATFDLNETDIHYLKDRLYTNIFIKDAWYVISKIVDFNPSNNSGTKVELLKMNPPTTFTPTIYEDTASDPTNNIDGGTPTVYLDQVVVTDFNNYGVVDEGDGTNIIRDECNHVISIDPGGNPTPIGDPPVPVANPMWNVLEGGEDELRDVNAQFDLNLVEGGEDELRDLFASGQWSVIRAIDGSAEYSDWTQAIGLVSIP